MCLERHERAIACCVITAFLSVAPCPRGSKPDPSRLVPCLPVNACPDTDPWVTAAAASAEEGSPGKMVLRKSFRTLGLCFRQGDLKNQRQDFPAVQGLRLCFHYRGQGFHP